MRTILFIVPLLFIQSLTATAKRDNFEEMQVSLSERLYKKLKNAHDAVSEKNYESAQTKLLELKEQTKNRSAEYAQVLQSLSYVYISKNQYAKAIETYEELLNMKRVPIKIGVPALYTLAQLQIQEKNYEKTISLLNEWLEYEEAPKAQAFILLGQAYAQVKKYNQAISNVEKAISMETIPQKNWLKLAVALLYENKNKKKAVEYLHRLVTIYPDDSSSWMQLSGLYMELGQDQKALLYSQMAEKLGYFSTESQYKQLTNLLFNQEQPYQAAQLFQKGLDLGAVPETEKNYDTLASAYLSSKEIDLALAVLEQATPKFKSAKLYAKYGYLLLEKQQMDKALDVFAKALELSQNNDQQLKKGKIYLAMGMAFYLKKDFAKSIESLSKSQNFEETSTQASQWLEHVNSAKSQLQHM